MKLLTMMIAIAMLAVVGLVPAGSAEAAVPNTWQECPDGVGHIIIKYANSVNRGGWVASVRFVNVSYAHSYRAEAAAHPLKMYPQIKSTTSAGWMGGGERGSNIYRAPYSKTGHAIRVVALNRSGDIVACATTKPPNHPTR